MICAAVSGVMVTRVSPLTTSISHTNSGMRSSVMPRQRMESIVAMTLMAVPSVPNPLTISAECPVIGRVAWRKRLRGQRRISQPAHIGRAPMP